MNVEFKSPVDVQIEITERCNHHCRHCYNTYSNTDNSCQKDMSLNDIEKVFEILSENEVLSVTLTGGEPFLNCSVLLKAIELFYEHGVYVSINSNLTLLPEEAILCMAKYPRIKVLTTLFSYKRECHDYICGERGGFDKTVKNIKRLVDAGIHVSVNMVLCLDNINDVYLTGKLVSELGCDAFCGTRVSAPLWNTEYRSAISNAQLCTSIDELIAVKKDFGINIDVLGCYPKCAILASSSHSFFGRRCMAGKTTVTIGSNCSVRPCSHSSKEYGNLSDTPLSVIWASMSDWRQDEYVPQKCKSCSLFCLCSGGCRVDAEARGDIRAMDVNAKPDAVHNFRFPKPAKVQTYSFSDEETFTIHPEAAFRKESFGGLLYIRNTMNILPVNRAAMEFLSSYPRAETLSFCQFLDASSAKDEREQFFVRSLFQKLVIKSFLVRGGEEDE